MSLNKTQAIINNDFSKELESILGKAKYSPNTQYPILNTNERNLLSSFRCAFGGLFYAFKTQPNLRIHSLIGTGAILSGLLLGFSYLELALLCLVIMFVIVSEIINTSLELSLDLFNGKKFNPLVKTAKDVIAAGVLLASLNAVVIGAILFSHHIMK